MRATLTVFLISFLLPAGNLRAQSFSSYVLALSYAPDFCNQPNVFKDHRECGPGRKIGFVVHGLWPQNENAKGPENCGGTPVPQPVIQATLTYIPTPSLIQYEWNTHGSCSGLSSADFFAALRKARDSVKLPADLTQLSQKLVLSPAQVESKFAATNPSLPAAAFRVSCYKDTGLQEVRVCFNKDLSPRACGSSAGQCEFPKILMLPVH